MLDVLSAEFVSPKASPYSPLAVELLANRMTVAPFKAKVGSLEFEASYRYVPDVPIPHLFSVTLPVVDIAELQRVFAPTLSRQSAMARTLGLSTGEVPDWLDRRRAEGTVKAAVVVWNGKRYPNARARVR